MFMTPLIVTVSFNDILYFILFYFTKKSGSPMSSIVCALVQDSAGANRLRETCRVTSRFNGADSMNNEYNRLIWFKPNFLLYFRRGSCGSADFGSSDKSEILTQLRANKSFH